uniref:SWIM-type domain-containing protein n=1 Tax=Dendroctonus ponderosae TaxID=77166 RepID=A0AAR5P088_DENPD
MHELKKSLIPQKAFDIFKRIEQSYKDQGRISSEELLALYSYFGEPLNEATEILEKCKITQYSTGDFCRQIFDISISEEQYAIFENINFCHCKFFEDKVLGEKTCITCKHVLAVYLAKATGELKKETLDHDVFQQYLNAQLGAYSNINM